MTRIRTRLATDWPEKNPLALRVLSAILFFIPRSNPDYRHKWHLVREWWIEFDQLGIPRREIGIDAAGKPVLAGPDARNIGYWIDEDMQLKDFIEKSGKDEVNAETFDACWNEFFAGRGSVLSAV